MPLAWSHLGPPPGAGDERADDDGHGGEGDGDVGRRVIALAAAAVASGATPVAPTTIVQPIHNGKRIRRGEMAPKTPSTDLGSIQYSKASGGKSNFAYRIYPPRPRLSLFDVQFSNQGFEIWRMHRLSVPAANGGLCWLWFSPNMHVLVRRSAVDFGSL